MADNFKRINKGLTFRPVGTPANPTNGDLYYNSTSNRFIGRINGVSDPLVSEAAAQTLTNKTFDASSNTVTNITNANIAAGAGIVYTKLNLSNSIVNADINTSAAIAYSKLNLALSIVNADISASAAIAYSKLNLALSIVNADVSATAAIAGTKISPDFGVQEVVSTTRYYVGVGTGSGGSSAAGFEINRGVNLNSTDTKGFYANFTSPSGSTASTRGIQINVGTSAAAYTSAEVEGAVVNAITLGAGSTITRAISYFGANQTVGTNNANFVDNIAFTGNWGLNLSGANPHYFAAPIRAGTTAAVGSGSEQISSIITGVAVGTLSGAVVTQANRADNSAITGNTRVISSNILRTITTSLTDTGAYSWFLVNGGTLTIPSGQTYTSSGTWAGFQYAAPSISGAGTAALSAIYGVLVGASATNYGTGKAGIAIGAQSGNTNNIGLLLGTTTIPTGTYELYSNGTNNSLFNGALGVSGDVVSGVNLSIGVTNVQTAASQADVQSRIQGSSAATTEIDGFVATPTTAAAAFTNALLAGFKFSPRTKGAGSTITRSVGFYASSAPNQGTNNATFADNASFSGNWFLNSTDTNPSLFSGPQEWKQQATPSNPAANQNRIYFKSDNKVYILDSSGTESLLATAGSGVTGPGTATVDAIPRWANTGGTSLANSSILINSLNQVGFVDGTIDAGFALTIKPSAANFNTMAGGGNFGAGIRMSLTAPSTMTSSVQGMVLRTNTTAAAFTCGVLEPILIIQDAPGAGSTQTQYTGIRFGQNTHSATNNAFISDTTGYSGNWFIYNGTITDSSKFLGPLRLGAATTDLVGTGPEQLTLINNSTGNTLAVRGGVFRANLNSNSAGTAAINAVRAEAYRQATAAVSDTTSQLSGLVARVAIDVGAGNVYTNAGTFCGDIQLGGLVMISGATPAISNWALIYASADTQANTGLKTGIQINGVSGGTVGNALLADNSSFTGDWFINSTVTNPSRLSGKLGILSNAGSTDIFMVGNQSTAANGVVTTTTQNGIATDFTASSAATAFVRGIRSFVRTENASFTTGVVANFLADTISKGASNTITRSIQYELSGALTVGTNNAGIADNESFVGNYFIHQNGTTQSSFAGPITVANALSVTGSNFDVTRSNSGGNVLGTIKNTSNTASSTAELLVQVAGTSAGSAFIELGASGVSNYRMIYDTADNFTFKLQDTQGPINIIEYFQDSANKAMGLMGSRAISDSIVEVGTNSVGLANATNLNVMRTAHTSVTANTGIYSGFASANTTKATAYTTAVRAGFRAVNVAKGAGSTITRDVKFFTDGASSQGGSNAQFADNQNFTSDWLMHFDDTREARFAGRISAGGDGSNTSLLTLGGGTNPLANTDQRGAIAFHTATSAATGSVVGFYASPTTAATAFTTALRAGFQHANATKGAGSTITRDIAFYGIQPTQGTNNALIADNAAFTGSYFLNSTSVKQSALSAPWVWTLSDTSSGLSTAMRLTGNSTGFTTSASQYGYYADPIFNSSATTEAYMFAGQVQTPNTAFTLPLAATFYSVQGSRGAASTITRMVNYYGIAQTMGTNNAFLSDNATFTGNFFIHQTGTTTTSLGGNLTTNQAVATTGFDTASPTTGQTVTASANKPGVLITPAGTIATATIKLPSSPIDGQQYWVASSQQITTVTWQDAGGTAGNVIGGQTTIGGTNKGQNFVYSSTNTKWYSIG